MNPIASLIFDGISGLVGIASAHARGEIDDSEAVRRLKASVQTWGASLDGFALGIAADRAAIDARIARLGNNPPPSPGPVVAPPPAAAGSGGSPAGGGT